MPHFTVTRLVEGDVAAAYPLVRMAAPEMPLEAWLEHARSLIDQDGGILAVSTGGAALQGIAVYRLERSLRHGRTLRVEAIVSFELSHAAPVRAALCEALEQLARSHGCDSLTITMPARGYAEAGSERARGWNGVGLELDGVVFARRLDPTPCDACRVHECA